MLLNIYNQTGRFPADNGIYKGADGKIRRGVGYIESEVKSVRWYEFLKIFAPVGLFAMVLYMFYGAIPKEVVPSTDKKIWGNTAMTMQKGLAEKSQRTEIPLPNEPSSKVKKDIVTAATRKVASSLPDGLSSKIKDQNSTPVTRKSASLLPKKSNVKANANESTLTTRKSAISVPKKPSTKAIADSSSSTSRKTTFSLSGKTNSKAQMDNSSSATWRTASSITSKSSSKTNPEGSTKAIRKTATSLPSNSTSKAKADKSVSVTRKAPPKLGILDAGAGKSKNEKPALAALAPQKKSVPTAAQETMSKGNKPLMPINRKVMTKNQLVKTSSGSRLSKEPATQASTKVTPKLPQPQQAAKKVDLKLPRAEPQPQVNQRRFESRPGGDSDPKTLPPQNIKPKGAVKRPSNVAVSERNHPKNRQVGK